MPTVSVIIPLYNKAPEIARSVGSVLAQSMTDLELIVVDDGSTDGGGELASRVGDPRLRVVRQENGGVGAARNRGVSETEAELVAFLDADDAWKPEFLATVLALRERCPDAALWAAAYVMSSEEGEPPSPPAIRNVPTTPEGDLIADFFDASSADSPLCSSNVMIRKTVLVELGGFPEGVALGEDWELWSRIALAYPIAYSPDVQAVYHLDAANRAAVRHRHTQGDTGLAQLLREAISDRRFEYTTPKTISAFLSRHLMVLARDCLAAGDEQRGRELIAEAGRYATAPDDYVGNVEWLAMLAIAEARFDRAHTVMTEAQPHYDTRERYRDSLVILAKDCIKQGDGRQAHAFLREARRSGPISARWVKTWFRAHLGAGGQRTRTQDADA